MTIKFQCKNSKEFKECSDIVRATVHSKYDVRSNTDPCKVLYSRTKLQVVVQMSNIDYFNDIQKAIQEMYEMKGPRYMTDLVSEIQKNLSFVPGVSASNSELDIYDV